MLNEKPYLTIDIERRGYGKRYTWLPVDQLTREGFVIDCEHAYVRPQMYDIRPGDIARWREGERLVEASVAQVSYEGERIHVQVEGAHPLPPEAFHP
ncbi:MAG: hypothetical protein H7Z42_13020 [Roseiflexaceae bacterium]|nr:hypothetical protein [Roseiflexaceae bacterium]